MSAGLSIVKITNKQYRLITELVVYFQMRYEHCLSMRKHDPWFEEPIPLKKIYLAKKCNSADKAAVKVAANIFFKQATRGSNLTGKCSTWEPRPEIHLNSQVRQMILDMYRDNIDHVSNLRTFLNTPEKENQIEMTTTFKFKTKEEAETFARMILALSKDEDE